jgi:hypothetical protein
MTCALRVLLVSLGLFAAAAKAGEVTLPIVDGMTLSTKAGLLQQVEVRAKSMGPGLCEVRVQFAGGTEVAVAAPPLVWSSWQKLSPAVAGGSYALAFTAKCDTGAIGEVRFDQ